MSKYQLFVCDCYLQIFDQSTSGELYSILRNVDCVCCTEYPETLSDVCEFCNQKLITAVAEMNERSKCECNM